MALNILLISVGALGFLPLVIVLYGRSKYMHVLKSGERVNATVGEILPGVRNRHGRVNERVVYYFVARDGRQYRGEFFALSGKQRRNATLEVYYLANDPTKNIVKGVGERTGFLIFVIVIAVFVVWAMWKVWLMT